MGPPMSGFSVSSKNLVATGAVGDTWARLWIRTERPGRHRVDLRAEGDERALTLEVPEHHGRDQTHIFVVPDDLPHATPLLPGSQYHYDIVRLADGVSLGTGRFETAPRTSPERYALAVASCHQPFDDEGRPSSRAAELLERAEAVLDEHQVRALVLCGDQMYTDAPSPFSLFDDTHFARVGPPGRSSILDCSAEEVRQLLHDRYRSFWASEPFQRLQARFASYPMIDDHELVDNFGSAEEHSSDRWAAFREGALDACHDYQTSRVLGHGGARPPSLHYSFRYGDLATFVMDLRSQRRVVEEEMRIVSREQLQDLERFLLEQNGDAHVLAVVLSVPLVHMPEMMTSMGTHLLGDGTDIHDRWSQPKARRSRDAVLRLLHRHRTQRPWQGLVLLGGDVHVGAVTELSWEDESVPAVFQLASSPLTNDQVRVAQRLSGLAFATTTHIETPDDMPDAHVRMLPGIGSMDRNPLPDLNIGLLSIQRTGARSHYSLGLIGASDDGVGLVYQSASLPGPVGSGPGAREP